MPMIASMHYRAHANMDYQIALEFMDPKMDGPPDDPTPDHASKS
jgi:hypothetical protein